MLLRPPSRIVQRKHLALLFGKRFILSELETNNFAGTEFHCLPGGLVPPNRLVLLGLPSIGGRMVNDRPSLRYPMRRAAFLAGLLSGLAGVLMDLDHLVPGLERKTHFLVVVVLGLVCIGAFTLAGRHHLKLVLGQLAIRIRTKHRSLKSSRS